MLQPLAPRFALFLLRHLAQPEVDSVRCGIWAAQKMMKCIVYAALLHVASTNNCERATDLKPAHICGAAINPDALRSAIPDAADAMPLHGGTPPSLNVITGPPHNRRRGSTQGQY